MVLLGEHTFSKQQCRPAYAVGFVALALNIIQMKMHISSEHDPSLPFTAGTPLKPVIIFRLF
jgi:hypothetical protein